jgi:hypothetical protein
VARVDPVAFTLAPGQEYVCPAVTFVPHRAGSACARVVVTVERPAGWPVGRWAGEIVIGVEDGRPGPVTVTGDMIVMGSDGSGALASVLGRGPPVRAMGPQEWALLDLYPDTEYAHRLASSCPLIPAPPELDGPVMHPGPVLMAVRDTRGGGEVRFGIAHGATAGFGRGGLAEPTWRIRPAQYTYLRHARLTGEHVVLALRDHRAWVTDHSRNGTWLKKTRLGPEPEFLADADEVALLPDRVVLLQIRLAADEHGVHAVAAHREARSTGRLSHLLTSGRCQAPLFWPGEEHPPLWVRWRFAAGGRPVAVITPSDGRGERAEVPENRPGVAGRFEIFWRTVPFPADERILLAPVAGWPPAVPVPVPVVAPVPAQTPRSG